MLLTCWAFGTQPEKFFAALQADVDGQVSACSVALVVPFSQQGMIALGKSRSPCDYVDCMQGSLFLLHVSQSLLPMCACRRSTSNELWHCCVLKFAVARECSCRDAILLQPLGLWLTSNYACTLFCLSTVGNHSLGFCYTPWQARCAGGHLGTDHTSTEPFCERKV